MTSECPNPFLSPRVFPSFISWIPTLRLTMNPTSHSMDKRHKKMRKRKAADDDGGDVTYINDANKVFNRKINRYFDKYTTESVPLSQQSSCSMPLTRSARPLCPRRIRANFERGTAL